MAATIYRQYLRLLKKWPTDSEAAGPRLGQYLRQRISEAFVKGDATTTVNAKECETIYKHLDDILNDVFKKQYRRHGTSSATGFQAELCRVILTPEGLSMIKYQHTGFFTRLKQFCFSWIQK